MITFLSILFAAYMFMHLVTSAFVLLALVESWTAIITARGWRNTYRDIAQLRGKPAPVALASLLLGQIALLLSAPFILSLLFILDETKFLKKAVFND